MATMSPRIDGVAGRRARASTWLAVLCLFGAEVIHTAVLPAHWRSWAAAGVFFAVISVAEGLLAAALLVVPSRRLAWSAIGLSGVTVLVWLVSRSYGLPFGPNAWRPELVAVPDSIATVFEVVTAGALVPLATNRAPAWLDDERWAGLPTGVATGMVVALAAIGLLARSAAHLH
jgi:hypothetical protein